MVSLPTPPAPASASIECSVDCSCQPDLSSRSPYSEVVDRYRPSKEGRKVVDGGCCLHCRRVYLSVELLSRRRRNKLPDGLENRLLHSPPTSRTNESALYGHPSERAAWVKALPDR